MAARRIYFDHNASAPLLPEAREAALRALDAGGNPSSVHAEGRRARATVERARASIAELVGADADCVVFTSGASEAASTCLTPAWTKDGEAISLSRLAVLETDHPCIRAGGRFPPCAVTRLAVDADGRLYAPDFDAWLNAGAVEGVRMLAVTLANSETGVIQPLGALERARASGAVVLLDGVQALGRLPLAMASLPCDALVLSGHKIGAMPGVGAYVLRDKRSGPSPLVAGGGQELGRRSGTEPVAAIASFGAAAEVAMARLSSRSGELLALRRRLEDGFGRIERATVVAGSVGRLANTAMVAVEGLRAETLQIALDLEGFAVSAGSACSSGKVGTSAVLAAMQAAGAPIEAATGAIRVSLGYETTASDIDAFLDAFERVVARARARQIVPRAA